MAEEVTPAAPATSVGIASLAGDEENLKQPVNKMDLAAEGAKRSELMQMVWGRHGKLLIFIGLALCMMVYELDNYSYGTYYIYALSDFQMTAHEAALTTAANLAFSLSKPIWAKISDLTGRGNVYPLSLIFTCTGMIVAASAKNFNAFAAGTIFRVVGITALNSLNTIVISDMTSTRARGFGVNIQFFPVLILPWCASYMVSAIISNVNIGWGWGIGIIAILYPFGIGMITVVLLIYERRAAKLEVGYAEKPKVTASKIISNMDLVGLTILIVGCGFILVPLSMGGTQPDGYKTPWVIVLMILGGLMLVVLPFYESRFASYPFLPLRYLKHRAICMGFLLYFTDYMAAATSFVYLYNWAVIAKDMSIIMATNLTYIKGVTTFFVGMLVGAILYKMRRFKWIIMCGLVIRVIGYGLMFRVRTSNPSNIEIFVIQAIQGVGDGIVQSGGYVAATINVPHQETAQMAALIVTIGMLGTSVGDAICGAIYTATMQAQLAKALGSSGTPELISNLFNSITTGVPSWGTPERDAIASAYNTVTSYFFIAAMVMIIPGFVICYFIPNQVLNDSQNLIEERGMFGEKQDERTLELEGSFVTQPTAEPAATPPSKETKA